MSRFFFKLIYAPIICVALLTASCSSTSGEPDSSAAAIPENPQKATPESIAAGKRVYQRYCENCHGMRGDGVGAVEVELTEAQTRAADLTDDEWDYGSTDGQIFLNIRNGLGPKSTMRGINGKAGIYPQEIWDTVNFVRSLHRSRPTGSAPAASSK